MLLEELYQKLQDKEAKMYEVRRWLHQHPELSFKEQKTSEYIKNFYQDKKDIKVDTGIGGNGIKVTIDTGKKGKTIALRADFDALPITEKTGLPFASKNDGVMHACGHDAHTAYLLILAEALIELKDKLNGKIVIIHQPGEEVPPGGASLMIKDGVLNGVDNVFGCHVMSQMDFGQVFYHKGATQQSRAKFTIKLQGVGGHGSSPHEANDAIVAASYLVTALQTIISRRINPFESGVVTIGSFEGNGTFNIIKDSVELLGDVRCISDDVSNIIEEQINQISKGIAMAFGCGVEVNYVKDYPVLINDPTMVELFIQSLKKAKIKEITELIDCGPLPPSEDFAYYSRELPCCFFYIGAKPEGESYPHHHPKFDIKEEAMMVAAKAMGATVLEYMNLL